MTRFLIVGSRSSRVLNFSEIFGLLKKNKYEVEITATNATNCLGSLINTRFVLVAELRNTATSTATKLGRKVKETIKDIIPCNVKMYAVVTRKDKTEERFPVLVFALWSDEDGDRIWPLTFNPEEGVYDIALHEWESDSVRYEIEGR